MDIRDYKIQGKPIREMTDDELRGHIERLRGARIAQPAAPRKARGEPREPKQDKLVDAEDI